MERTTTMGRLGRLALDVHVPRRPMTDSRQPPVVAATTFGVRSLDMPAPEVGSPEPSTVVEMPMAGRQRVVERAITETGSPEHPTVVGIPTARRHADRVVERATTEVGAPEPSTVVEMPMAGRPADEAMERAITRPAIPARGIEAIPLVAHAESQPGGLLLHRSPVPFANLARPRDALWRHDGGLATPALPTESANAHGELVGRPSDIRTPADIRMIDRVAQEWRSSEGPVGTGRSPWSKNLATALAPVRSVTISRFALGPAKAWWGGQHEDPGPALTDGHELVFAVHPAESVPVTTVQRTSESALQAAPAPMTAVANVPTAPRQDVRAGEAPAGTSNRPVDLDELVDRAWQKLMRKVSIEQERRGYARWDWQS